MRTKKRAITNLRRNGIHAKVSSSMFGHHQSVQLLLQYIEYRRYTHSAQGAFFYSWHECQERHCPALLNRLKACDICKLQDLKFYHKLINRQPPKSFECFVHQTNLDIHNYNTRRSHRLHIPRINHAFAQLNIRHGVIQTVNSVPDNVVDKIRTHNLKEFSTYAKNYFISTYETTCEIANCYVCKQLSGIRNTAELGAPGFP